MTQKQASNRRLRQQPTIRRVQVAMPAAPPKLVVPRTAQKRRRRNNETIQRPVALLKQAVLTSRWVSLGILLLCAFALYLIGGDQAFALNSIPVAGAEVIPPQEIVAASGLAGVHVFGADPEEAAARVAALPGVISATVSLEWPNQALIQIQEDTPVAVWRQNGQSFWISQAGALFPARASTPGLLVIEAEAEAPLIAPPPEPTPEAALEAEAETEAAAATPAAVGLPFVPADVLQGALQLRQLRPNIETLYYRPSGGLSYQDGRDWRAYFGVGDDMAQKLVVYETLVDRLLAANLRLEYVSVSNPQKPFYLAFGGEE